MADPREYTIMEERQEQMVSPRGENSTRRVGHFLKPSVTTIEVKVFNLPSDSLSSATPTSQAKKSTLKVEFNVVKRVVKIGDRERENHYGNLQSVEQLMNLGKMVGTGELVVERSERVVVGENVSGAENTEIVSEISEQELEARLTRLEIKLAKLKEERLGRSLESKSAEGS
ncbi:hypothetical protein TEA_012272 [Camellia sinensis var. sinensis]|uniref:Uncharacterized protein n=1 Tax=Camellia sinensis var. sinensis TaxID=542762 RepID=A0A4S4DHM9_CAMSN|nr:hypothetical protein TEA_012272 [Camellia sinensis var. sinensis]